MSALSWLAESACDISELLISDLVGCRPRRNSRLITRRVYPRPRQPVYHIHYHQSPLRRSR